MQRILQLGCFGMDNLGDELGAQEIRRQIRLRWPDPTLEFTMVTRDPAHSARNHPDVASFVSEDDMERGRLCLRDFALMTLGGGTLLGLSIIRSARIFLRLPGSDASSLFIWGCGVDPITPGARPAELLGLCSIARCITVRNRRCADYLANAGVTDRVHATADPLFSVPLPARKPAPIITVTLCEKLRRLGWSERRALMRTLARALARHCAETGARLTFLPMRVQGHKKWRSDLEWASALQRLLPCDMQVTGDNLPETVLNHLAQTGMYIGTRLHGCLLAAATGCRVISIGWEEKMGHLFDDLGLGKSLLRPADLRTTDGLDAALKTAVPADPETIGALRRRAESTVALVEF